MADYYSNIDWNNLVLIESDSDEFPSTLWATNVAGCAEWAWDDATCPVLVGGSLTREAPEILRIRVDMGNKTILLPTRNVSELSEDLWLEMGRIELKDQQDPVRLPTGCRIYFYLALRERKYRVPEEMTASSLIQHALLFVEFRKWNVKGDLDTQAGLAFHRILCELCESPAITKYLGARLARCGIDWSTDKHLYKEMEKMIEDDARENCPFPSILREIDAEIERREAAPK